MCPHNSCASASFVCDCLSVTCPGRAALPEKRALGGRSGGGEGDEGAVGGLAGLSGLTFLRGLLAGKRKQPLCALPLLTSAVLSRILLPGGL